MFFCSVYVSHNLYMIMQGLICCLNTHFSMVACHVQTSTFAVSPSESNIKAHRNTYGILKYKRSGAFGEFIGNSENTRN